MSVSQLLVPFIPIWRSLAAACVALLALSACTDQTEAASVHAMAAQRLFADNDLPAARAEIASAIAARDDIVDYHVLRGRIEWGMDSPGGAFNAYSNALALDATNGEALLAVAQLGLTTGNLRESLEAAERISALAPNQTEAILIRGIHALIRRRYDEAIGFGERILSLAPGDPGGTILISRAHFLSGNAAEAVSILGTVEETPGSARALALTRLEIYRALRRPEMLAQQFEQLRQVLPDDPHIRIDEANFRFKLGQRAVAHRLVFETLTLDELDSATANAAAALWTEYGSDDLPSPTILAISKSGNLAARRAATRHFLEIDDLQSAKVLADSLGAPAGAGLRARWLVRSGQADEGEKLAMSVLALDRTDCDSLIAASESLLAKRQATNALRLAQQAAAECPDQMATWEAAARAYMASGLDSGVSRIFQQALDANKQSRVLAESYAEWLAKEGRDREAIAVGRRLTRYAPALVSGWRLYADLCRDLRSQCLADAESGLADSRTRFGIDLAYGSSPPNGLFGRFVER